MYEIHSKLKTKIPIRYLVLLLLTLNIFLNKILKGLEKIMMTGMILIDLQKAFDTIDHDVLWQKFYATGFLKHTVNWF